MSLNSRLLRPVGCLLGIASLCTTLAMPATVAYAVDTPSFKREIVTATTNASGSVRTITVTTTLETDGRTTVVDNSDLYHIEYDDKKISGTQSNGILQWSSSDGRDITYTGQSNTALPVQLNISYTLDGDPIQPSELVGKKGHVTIRYTYRDAEQELKGTTPYLPFAAVTRVPLDTSIYSNIKVSNGKLVRDLDADDPENPSPIVYALGGGVTSSTESLTEEQLKALPTSFEIEADVSYFTLASATTIMSTDLLSCLDSELMDISETSDSLADAYEDFVLRLEDIRTTIEDLQKEAEDLSEDFDKASDLAEDLELAEGELDTAQKSADEMNIHTETLIEQSDYVSSALNEFYNYIGSVDGLTDEQLSALYDKWSELDIDGSFKEVSDGARYLRELGDNFDLPETAKVTDTLKDLDFKHMIEATDDLSDTLKELLEDDFGKPEDVNPEEPVKNEKGEEEQTTLFGDANELQEKLVDKLNEDLMLPTSTAAGLGSSHLLVTAKTPEKKTEEEKGAKDGTVAKVNRVIDEVFNGVVAESDKQESEKKGYTNYGGITEDTEGSVQFVLQAPGIK